MSKVEKVNESVFPTKGPRCFCGMTLRGPEIADGFCEKCYKKHCVQEDELEAIAQRAGGD